MQSKLKKILTAIQLNWCFLKWRYQNDLSIYSTNKVVFPSKQCLAIPTNLRNTCTWITAHQSSESKKKSNWNAGLKCLTSLALWSESFHFFARILHRLPWNCFKRKKTMGLPGHVDLYMGQSLLTGAWKALIRTEKRPDFQVGPPNNFLGKLGL